MKLGRLVRAATLAVSLAAVSVGVASVVGTGVASADLASIGEPLCPGEGQPVPPSTTPTPVTAQALAGTYRNLTVHGNAYVADNTTLTVTGNLRLAPGACLDAFSLGTVHVGHNILVRYGATLALGCAPLVNFGGPGAPPPGGVAPCFTHTTDDTVGGSILAHAPQTMYLTSVHVAHNVISIGGGQNGPFLSFPVKNMMIGGNLILAGWHGATGPNTSTWIGAINNTVGGNMLVLHNVGSRTGENGVADSTEVTNNTVGRNLICFGNTPAAQFGDAPPTPPATTTANTVGGHALGECATLAGGTASGQSTDHGRGHHHGSGHHHGHSHSRHHA